MKIIDHLLEHVGDRFERIPAKIYSQLRSEHPIVTLPPLPSFREPKFKAAVLVTRRADVLEVLENSVVFSVRTYADKFENSVGSSMLGTDNAAPNLVEKPLLRSLLSRDDFPLIRRQVAQFTAEAIAAATTASVDPATGHRHGRLDIVAPIARRVPLRLTGSYFGFPGPDEATMSRWSLAIQNDLKNLLGIGARHAAAGAAGAEMRAYLFDLVRERRAAIAHSPNGDDTILGRMLKLDAKAPGQPPLTDERTVVTIAGMLIGAVETTQWCVVQSIAELFSRPHELAGAIQAAHANNDGLLGRYVWEALRFRPPAPILPRYAEQDYILARGKPHETKIAQGSLVIAGTHSAMFDDTYVNSPDEFRTDRPDDVYLHLGHGHHRCLGDFVSLIEIPLIVKGLLQQKNLRPAADAGGKFVYNPIACPPHYFLEYDLAAAG